MNGIVDVLNGGNFDVGATRWVTTHVVELAGSVTAILVSKRCYKLYVK